MLRFKIKKIIRNWIYKILDNPESPVKRIELQNKEISGAISGLSEKFNCIYSDTSGLEAPLMNYAICNNYLQQYHSKSRQKDYLDHFVSYYYEAPSGVANLGDYIQTIATERAIMCCVKDRKVVFEPVLRSHLVAHQGGTCVMQGWYEHKQLSFLPGPDTRPVWMGTHFCKEARKLLLYLYHNSEIRFHDIGCRDKSTLAFCRSMGISSYLSRCLTLTLPKRSILEGEKADKVYIVDCSMEIISSLPDSIKKGAIVKDQRSFEYASWQDWRMCRTAAEELLEEYRQNARLVVTTALHCAQPCIAMGIPVVFINPKYIEEERFSSMDGIIPQYTLTDLKENRIVYPSEAPNIEDLKVSILRNLELTLKIHLSEEEKEERKQVRDFIESYSVNKLN